MPLRIEADSTVPVQPCILKPQAKGCLAGPDYVPLFGFSPGRAVARYWKAICKRFPLAAIRQRPKGLAKGMRLRLRIG